MDLVNDIINHSTDIIASGGLLAGFFLVFLECFIPALPLCVFVALNINAFGFFIGTLISWIATCLGSFLCYLLFLFLEKKIHYKVLGKKRLSKLKKSIDKFKNIKFSTLVIIISLPFIPSSLVNILCGISRVEKEKYICALLIGKVFCILFWGFIGKSFIESLTDIKSMIYIFITLSIAYIISKIVSKKLNIQ